MSVIVISRLGVRAHPHAGRWVETAVNAELVAARAPMGASSSGSPVGAIRDAGAAVCLSSCHTYQRTDLNMPWNVEDHVSRKVYHMFLRAFVPSAEIALLHIGSSCQRQNAS